MSPSSSGPSLADYRDETWQASLLRTILIVLMAGSFAGGPVAVRYALIGRWSGYLIPAAIACATLAVLTTTALGRPTWRDRRGAAFRLGEIVLILVVTRLLAWLFGEGLPQISDATAWLADPGLFFSGEFIFGAVLLLFLWSVAATITADFLDLAIQPDEVAARFHRELGDSKSRWRAGQPVSRVQILQGFAVRWIGLGIVLVVCAGLTRVEVSFANEGRFQLGLGGLGLRGEVVVCMVCYFLAGVLLLSHGRLAVLRARWFNQEAEIASPLIRRWHANSLVFVALVALAALLLPLGTTGWFVGAVEWLIALIARIMLGVAFVLGVIFSFFASLLRRLFGDPQLAPPPPGPLPPAAIPSQVEMTRQLPSWLGGSVLLLVVGLLAGFLLLNFLRATGVLEGVLGVPLLRWRLWWRAKRARLDENVAALRARLRRVRWRGRRWGRPVAPPESRVQGNLPRERVRKYYLRAVKEAGEEGVTRRGGETPLEFAGDLARTWPDAEEDVRDLTEAFLDARYSTHEIEDRQVQRAETAWRGLVRALRGEKAERDG